MGSEKVNGINSRIIGFTDTFGSAPVFVKLWVSEEYGFPVKIDLTDFVIELKELEFNLVEDSVFVCGVSG